MPRRRPPLLLIIVCGLLFFIGFEMGGFQLVLRSVSGEFAMTTTGAGLLVAAQYLGVVLMPPLFGSLSDRIGKKRVLLLSALAFCAGCVLAATCGGALSFVAGVFLVGAGYSVCETAGSAALADAYPEKSAKYINLSQCALSVGAVVSPLIVQRGMDALGWNWRAAFFICAAGGAPLLIALFCVRDGAAGDARRTPAEARGKLYDFLRAPVYRLLLFSILLYVGLENGVGYFTESFFALELGHAPLGAYAISAYWAAMALSRLLCGLSPLSPRRTLLVGFGASALLFTLFAALRAPYLTLLTCALLGFAFGPLWSLLMDAAAKRFPARTGGAIGLMSAGCGLGGVAFPALMGLVADTMRLRSAFLLLAAAALLAGGLCYAAFAKDTQDKNNTMR